MQQIIDFFLHIDDELIKITADYGVWTYGILFAIIFVETGLVIMPFLPGDSLLFAAGAIAANPDSGLNVGIVCLLLSIAAVLGDTVNYHIGRYLGPKVLSGKLSRWLNPKHLEKTQEFFATYGPKTIVIARFVPIVRTFAPFVAGVGQMDYRRFLIYNVAGGIFWVLSMTFAGYWFGRIEWVSKNFEVVVLAIIFVSILPAIVEFIRHRYFAPRVAKMEVPAVPTTDCAKDKA
ncbi:Inner membrane protein YqjA [Anatilimnocola aggregata]|uniref:Inner membrane protein YqjA n=1 Tax=Anatilimnocola aggregata TaxID=2528021 RepID=A0A517YET8_9BACT|nr:DedA family protein [Anatilimnocola aggregata]QDU28750.1 Inner membrane protein YqjA [Anatilimnocola aggregata]